MVRPSVSDDTQRRLFDVANEIDDELPPSASHEEAVTTVLDYVDNVEDGEDGENVAASWEEVIGEDTQGVGQLPGRSSGGRF